jgi:Mor family transcriptional regulator
MGEGLDISSSDLPTERLRKNWPSLVVPMPAVSFAPHERWGLEKLALVDGQIIEPSEIG